METRGITTSIWALWMANVFVQSIQQQLGAHSKAEAETILRRKILEYENAGTVFKLQEITLHDY